MINDKNNCLQGWVKTTLGDCLRLSNGRAYLRPELLDKGTPIIRIQNLNGGNNWFYSDLELPDDKYCDKGDLLFAWSATFGPFIWNGSRSIYHYHIWKVEPSDALDQKFAYYLLTEITELVKAAAHGVAMPHMTKQGMESWQVELPPLNEQRRIAAKIEALKARSQRVKEELEAIAPLLDQFRQSVLAAAFRGNLTADWREKNPDVEPASVLLERIRAERCRRWEEAELEKMKAQGKTPKDDKWKSKYKEPEPIDTTLLPELPDGWCWASLDEVSAIQGGIQKQPKRTPNKNAYPFLRVANVPRGRLNLEDVHQVELFIGELERLRLVKGDLLIVEGNGSPSEIGRTAIWDGSIKDCVHQNHLIRVRLSKSLKPEFIEAYWNSPQGRAKVFEVAHTTTGLYTLSVSKIARLPVPLAPEAEQIALKKKLDKLFQIKAYLQTLMAQGKEDVNSLNQSILAKAFQGELVPQDPNDEPASVLLERIRAEREKLDTKKKAKGKTEKKSRKEKVEPTEPEQLRLPGFE